MKIKIIFLLVILTIGGLRLSAQGCNDAGLCSMGDLDGQGLGMGNKYNTQLSYFFVLGERQTLINTLQFEHRFMFLDDRVQVFLQLPFHYINGNLGQTFGVGDISLGLNYTYIRKKEIIASFLIAAKLPPNESNQTIDEKGVPMVYQTSLGTYAIAFGANFFYRKWQVGLGYLTPFGSNRNYFYHSEWPDNEDALKYTEMHDLQRGDDAMLRLNRFFYTKKNRYNVGLLTLYRMQKDVITQGEERKALENSDGLTLNINLGYQRILSNNDAITVSFGAPLVTREVRVDGLTRTFVLMFTYAFGSKKKDNVFQPFEYGN